jgi:hypothetical protein
MKKVIADHETNKYFLPVKPKLMNSMFHEIKNGEINFSTVFVTGFPHLHSHISVNLIFKRIP